MKKPAGRAAVLVMAGVMGVIAPMTSLAASPEFSRSSEEWESLRDDVLEYEELADLIHEYNPTVQNNQYEYNKFIQDYGTTREDIADEYRDMAEDLEASMTGEDGIGMVSDFQLKLQADNLREQADDVLEDSQIYYWTYCQTEDTLVQAAQSKFLSYYEGQISLETAEATKRDLETAYEQTVLSSQAGMATQMEVLDAQKAIQDQEKTIAELSQQIENTRQSLIVMCGWNSGDQPEITEVPELDFDELDAINPETDQETALETNYTLKINRKKLENAREETTRENLRDTIAGNERQIRLSVNNAYQSLQTARRSYEQAKSTQEAEERNLTLAAQKLSAGMITQAEYDKTENTTESSRLSVRTAYLNLVEALESYRWTVNGMADAG